MKKEEIKESEKKKKVKEKKEENKKNKYIKFQILAIVAIIIFCISICPVTLQNDTYYTIKVGEHILNTKTIDMKDHFSIHNLPYTYPHWAYDAMIYFFYTIGGMQAIFISTIIFTCILGILMYYTNYKISKNKPISFMITIGAMFLLKDFVAARAQLVTFILFELVILLIEEFLEKKKIRYLLGIVLIGVAIANLHCAVWPFLFVIFLPYVAEYVIYSIVDANIIYKIKLIIYKKRLKINKKKLENVKSENKKEKYNKNINNIKLKQEKEKNRNRIILKDIEEKRKNPYKIRYNKNKNVKWLIFVMIVLTFTGLITPLGDTPYTYLYKTIQGNTTESISEHLPLTLINNKPMLVVLILILVLLIFTDTKISLKDLFMISGLTLLMFITRRQESMLVLLGSAVISKLITDLFMKYDKNGLEKLEEIMISSLGTIATILVIAMISIVDIKPKLKDKFINSSEYPVEAAEYIKSNLDLSQIRLFNEYNYGSYLLYQGIPVFIDSRADLYAPEFNGKKNEEGKYDGEDIFNDYIKTSNMSTHYETTFDKYDITHVILYKNSKLNRYLAKDDKYKELHSDKKFIIYERDLI